MARPAAAIAGPVPSRPATAPAARSTELVCGINHAFLGGVLDGLETAGLDAVLVRCPGRCCVEICEAGAAAAGHEPTVGGECGVRGRSSTSESTS